MSISPFSQIKKKIRKYLDPHKIPRPALFFMNFAEPIVHTTSHYHYGRNSALTYHEKNCSLFEHQSAQKLIIYDNNILIY